MSDLSSALAQSITRAAAALAAQRNAAGYWEGELAASPLGTSVSLCALKDGELSRERAEKAFAYLAKTQNPDGGWGDTDRSQSNLAATLLALCADACWNPDSYKNTPTNTEAPRDHAVGLNRHQRWHAESFVQKLGGLRDGLRRVYGADLTFQVPIRMTAATAGLLPWRDVEALPFELALAPRGLMGALRLPVVSYALPALVSVGLARHGQAPTWLLPLRWLREAIADRALAAILKMQPQSGGYLEASPITAFCILGLKAAGRGSHPVAQNAIKFLLDTQRADGAWAVEVNLSIWNTTRAVDALAAAGLLESTLSEKERNTTRDWLLEQQTKKPSVYSDATPGGWGWNHLDGSVPDADDTAGALIALRHLGVDACEPAIVRGAQWLLGLQNNNGGWPTFCRGWNKLPFDRSAPDLTGHVLRALTDVGATGLRPYADPCRADDVTNHRHGSTNSRRPVAPAEQSGWDYLAREQRPDGSFVPLWFGCEAAPDKANATYGTAIVLSACANNLRANSSLTQRALAFLRGIQNADGGFGGCARAPSTAEETGLALRALVMHGGNLQDVACIRAARWLLERQRADGNWDPAPIGFYFAVLWYYERLYPLCYALGGLGALAGTAQGDSEQLEVKRITADAG